MCENVVLENPKKLQVVRNHFNTQEMCERAVKRLSYSFSYNTDQYKTQHMCETIVLKDPENLQFVPNHFKT